MVNEQYDRAKCILTEYAKGHNELADLLVEREVIFAEDLERIFGKRPWTSRTQEILDEQKKIEEAKELEALNAALIKSDNTDTESEVKGIEAISDANSEVDSASGLSDDSGTTN